MLRLDSFSHPSILYFLFPNVPLSSAYLHWKMFSIFIDSYLNWLPLLINNCGLMKMFIIFFIALSHFHIRFLLLWFAVPSCDLLGSKSQYVKWYWFLVGGHRFSDFMNPLRSSTACCGNSSCLLSRAMSLKETNERIMIGEVCPVADSFSCFCCITGCVRGKREVLKIPQ